MTTMRSFTTAPLLFALLAAGCSSVSPAPRPSALPGSTDGGPAIEDGPDAGQGPTTTVDADAAGADDAGVDGAADETPDAAPITLTAGDAGAVTFDLISPIRCAERSQHLVHCAFPTVTILAGASTPTPPVATTLTTAVSGDCSTQYQLALRLDAAGAPSTKFHIEDKAATIARSDGQTIDALTVTDDSPWTGVAAFDSTCRITITVAMNAPAH